MTLRELAGDTLARLTRMEEALADGDSELARTILLDLGRELEDVLYPRTRCLRCGEGFRWPGELEAHLYTAHWEEGAA